MLPKQYRLPKNMQVAIKKNIPSPFFILKFVDNNLPYSRFGFIVSKRVDKKAVVRNYIKRKYRACIEGKLGKIKNGYDILFVIKKESSSKEVLSNMCNSISQSLSKGALLL